MAIGKVRVETDGGQGATKVNEDDIIGVVREYLEDKENSYALMLTGEWGCGKTYFVEHALTEKLEEDESRHPVVVASAYGAKDLAELCGAIESGFISKYAIGCAAGGERGRWDSLVGFAKDTGISFLGKKIREGGADRKLDRGAVRTGGSHVQQGEGRALPPGDGGRHGADRRREVRGGLGGRGQEVGDGAPPAQLHRGAL